MSSLSGLLNMERSVKTGSFLNYPRGSGIEHPCGLAACTPSFSPVRPAGSGRVLFCFAVISFVGFPCLFPRLQQWSGLESSANGFPFVVPLVHQRSADANRAPSRLPHASLARHDNACNKPLCRVAEMALPSVLVPCAQPIEARGNVASCQGLRFSACEPALRGAAACSFRVFSILAMKASRSRRMTCRCSRVRLLCGE